MYMKEKPIETRDNTTRIENTRYYFMLYFSDSSIVQTNMSNVLARCRSEIKTDYKYSANIIKMQVPRIHNSSNDIYLFI